jgi:organic hydroperoxide reductase OsmC/OhrA
MAANQHRYHVHLVWTGGPGSASFRNHNRDYLLRSGDKPPISGSSDAIFRGNAARWNPEDLLVASLSACHQLWYLGLCAEAGIVVTAYEDDAEGVMIEEKSGGAGQFTEVILRPRVTLAPGSDQATAKALHHTAHERCFIARSMNFPVTHTPVVMIESAPGSELQQA